VQITAPSGDQTGQAPQVITVREDGRRHGFGFFPFGFLLFPLLLIGIIWLIIGGWWRRGGPGGGGWEGRFEEWHRRQHQGESDAQGQSSAPSA
jgi:hypothetical protein